MRLRALVAPSGVWAPTLPPGTHTLCDPSPEGGRHLPGLEEVGGTEVGLSPAGSMKEAPSCPGERPLPQGPGSGLQPPASEKQSLSTHHVSGQGCQQPCGF